MALIKNQTSRSSVSFTIRREFIHPFVFFCIGSLLISCDYSIEQNLQNPEVLPRTLSPQTPYSNIENTMIVFEKINLIDEAKLIFIPFGEFQMGAELKVNLDLCSQYRDDCQAEDFIDEKPIHPVQLTSFWIYKSEVSNSMYRMCVEGGICSSPLLTDFFNHNGYADHPVVYIDWNSAQQYCNWAGGRLPTEAEWEKAAHGGNKLIFPWGDILDCEHANFQGCAAEMTMPVESLPIGASPFGVLHLAGNVSEWTADWYDAEYYATAPEFNPEGPESGELRVIRGGSWKNQALGLRTTNRVANYPEIFSTGIGFRCVIDPE